MDFGVYDILLNESWMSLSMSVCRDPTWAYLLVNKPARQIWGSSIFWEPSRSHISMVSRKMLNDNFLFDEWLGLVQSYECVHDSVTSERTCRLQSGRQISGVSLCQICLACLWLWRPDSSLTNCVITSALTDSAGEHISLSAPKHNAVSLAANDEWPAFVLVFLFFLS